MAEKSVVHSIKKAIEKSYPGALVYKIHGGQYQEAGIPDLLCCIFGTFIGIEAKFKRPGESEEHARAKTSPQQEFQIQRILDSGGVAFVALSAEDALVQLDWALRE